MHIDEEDSLKEAIAIINELLYAINTNIGCPRKDFLGETLSRRVNMFLYGCDDNSAEHCQYCGVKLKADDTNDLLCSECLGDDERWSEK